MLCSRSLPRTAAAAAVSSQRRSLHCLAANVSTRPALTRLSINRPRCSLVSRTQLHVAAPLDPTTDAVSLPLPAPSLVGAPLPAPHFHAIVYGGGSMGLFHASLMQLRAEESRRLARLQTTSARAPLEPLPLLQDSVAEVLAHSADAPPPPPSALSTSADLHSSSVRVVSGQRDLVTVLHSKGMQLELLCDFVRDNRDWLCVADADQASVAGEIVSEHGAWICSGGSPNALEQQLRGNSHYRLPRPIRVPATCSALTCPSIALTQLTHVLILTKGESAFKRACEELYTLLRSQQESAGFMPAVCLLMNGLGHRERLLEYMQEQLRLEEDPPLSLKQQTHWMQQFSAHLYVATTTTGAKLEKHYCRVFPTGDQQLTILRVKHGGQGVTTVIQNEADANAAAALANSSDLPPPSGSTSLVSLFRSLGLQTQLAPFSSMKSILWTKLLVNCCINPLTALHHVPNGALRGDEYTETIVTLARECVWLMKQLDIPVAPLPPSAIAAAHSNSSDEASIWPSNIAMFEPKPLADAETDAELNRALHHVYDTIQRTRHNFSSMVNDLHGEEQARGAGFTRPVKTEIDNINGFLINTARQHAFDVEDKLKANNEMIKRIKQAERIKNQIKPAPNLK